MPLKAALVLPDGPAGGPTPVLSYSQSARLDTGTGHASYSELTLTRAAGDSTTTFLRKALFFRTRLQHGAAITLTPAGQTHPRMEITLGQVTVDSDEISGSSGQIPVEKVSLGFVLVGVEVFTPDGHGGWTETQGCSMNPDGTYGCPAPVA